jgi:hypothetical protein
MLAVLVAQWMRHAEREARRVDRKLDREEAADAVGTPWFAVPAAADAAPGTAAGAGSGNGDEYDPLGSRDTQGASSR